jgi:hypothetical protein
MILSTTCESANMGGTRSPNPFPSFPNRRVHSRTGRMPIFSLLFYSSRARGRPTVPITSVSAAGRHAVRYHALHASKAARHISPVPVQCHWHLPQILWYERMWKRTGRYAERIDAHSGSNWRLPASCGKRFHWTSGCAARHCELERAGGRWTSS